MSLSIRPYQAGDEAAVYDICVRTGDDGQDATGRLDDVQLLADIWAGPYLFLEPDLAFVLDDGERPVGYVLGTADTATFVESYRKSWLPRFSEALPARTIAAGHGGKAAPLRFTPPGADALPGADGLPGPPAHRYPACAPGRRERAPSDRDLRPGGDARRRRRPARGGVAHQHPRPRLLLKSRFRETSYHRRRSLLLRPENSCDLKTAHYGDKADHPPAIATKARGGTT